MPEIQQSGVREGLNAQEFLLNTTVPESAITPDMLAAQAWYKERVDALPEYKVGKTTLTGEKWKGEMAPNGEIDAIRGAHFDVEGRSIQSSFSWDQPLIQQRSEQARGTDGEVLDVSGIIILIKDPDGRMLMVTTQEPGADEVRDDGIEKHPSVRTPLQSSVQKLKDIAEGKDKVDEVMKAALMSLTTPEKTLSDIIRELLVRKVSTDGNRMRSNVYYGVLHVDEDMAAKLETTTAGRFLTHDQVNSLDAVNGHTHIAISKTKDQ